MEKILKKLQKQIKAKFWLSADGEVVYSDMCTIYPDAMRVIVDCDLIVDTYISFMRPRLRFFKNCSK